MKMYFYYGVMGSSKTACALMKKFNFEEKGKTVALLKPAIDSRDGITLLKSRIGLCSEALVIGQSDNIFEKLLEAGFFLEGEAVGGLGYINLENSQGREAPTKLGKPLDDSLDLCPLPNPTQPPNPLDIIIVDESQFLTKSQVDDLRKLADAGIMVMCYGLRTDYMGQLFEGSLRLFETADSIREIQSMCHCGRKATMTARYEAGQIVYSGAQVDLGGNEKYMPLCHRCWAKGCVYY